MSNKQQNSTKYFDEFKLHFSNALRKQCEAKTSINQICSEIGINRQQFAKYLSGNNLPSIYVLQRLIKYFDVNPSEFFLVGGSDDEELGFTEAADIKLGFYLEYSSSYEVPNKALKVSAWRFYKSHSGIKCHGEVPNAAQAHIAFNFLRYRGSISGLGANYLMRAGTRGEAEKDIFAILTPYEFSPNDLLVVKVGGQRMKTTPIFGSASIFRYVGEDADASDLIIEHCGIFNADSLDKRVAAIWHQLQQRCQVGEAHIVLNP